MKHIFIASRLGGAALALLIGALPTPKLAAVEVKELNLVGESTFKPVEMHGRTTAAYGWTMTDRARQRVSGVNGNYLSGEGLFNLKVEDGTMTITFPEKLHQAYKPGLKMIFATTIYRPTLSGKFRLRARVKVERGRFAFSDGAVIKNSPEWQEIDRVVKRSVGGFSYVPVANGGFSISHFSLCPEYDKLGGEINLPDGGKLTKLLLPRNSDQSMRWCIALWQNWLWRLTGTALPVEVVDEIKPTKGALAVVMGETAPGGWQLKVDKDGIVVTCGEPAVFGPAVLDYMRDLGHTVYHYRIPVKITPDPNLTLKAADKKISPHYRYFIWGADITGNNDRHQLYTRNMVDYYHLPKDTMDHLLNLVLPSEMYYKEHPEYYALDKYGKREIQNYIFRTSPCFANRDAFEISAKNLVKYALGQPFRPHLLFYIGDGGHSCQCDECAKVNRGVKGHYSEMMMRFLNRVAKELQTKRPGMRVTYGAYSDSHEPPLTIKPEPNIYCSFAVTQDKGFPCSVHNECELNKAGWDEVKVWSNYIGRDKLGPMTYRDLRPIHYTERLKLFNQYMSYEIFTWIWFGFSPAVPFVFTRWNYGEDDIVALMKEFDEHYYGKAGKYVSEVMLLVEDYARNYKHTKEEFEKTRRDSKALVCIRCGSFNSKTVLDRRTLDKIYELLDRGLSELGKDDKLFRQNVLWEKATFLFEDLNRYRLSSCKNDQELAAYADRVAEMVRIAREVPQVRGKFSPSVSGSDMFTQFTGIAIVPSKKSWVRSPEVEKFMKDPVKALSAAPEKIPGGLRFGPRLMRGGFGSIMYRYNCPPRVANFVQRVSSGKHEITIRFNLDNDIPENTMLSMIGLDDDKPGVSRFAVEVNGERIFEGPDTFPDNNWGPMGVQIPGGLLKKGLNIITLVNTTHEEVGTSDAAGDYTWGWVGFAEVCLLNPNGGFKTFLKGGKDHGGWYQVKDKTSPPSGKVKVIDGKLYIEGGDDTLTGVAFFRRHKFKRIAVAPYRAVSVKVTASGEGTLTIDFLLYAKKHIIGRKAASRSFKLSATPQTFTHTFQIPDKAIYIVPEIMSDGRSKAVVSSFDMNFEPRPEKATAAIPE